MHHLVSVFFYEPRKKSLEVSVLVEFEPKIHCNYLVSFPPHSFPFTLFSRWVHVMNHLIPSVTCPFIHVLYQVFLSHNSFWLDRIPPSSPFLICIFNLIHMHEETALGTSLQHHSINGPFTSFLLLLCIIYTLEFIMHELRKPCPIKECTVSVHSSSSF